MDISADKLSKEVTDKYSVVSNAFRLSKVESVELDINNKPKDLINVEVGDTKQTEFYPQVKLCRWGDDEESNEVNFSIRLIDTEYDKAKVSSLQDKILWEKGNVNIEFYDFVEDEGDYKMVWYLKEKPTTNKLEFSIQSKNLDFFYQPPLTQEYQNGYSEEFQKEIVVTETQVKDLDGNVLAERPENVVGSYAVYHSTKGGINDANGKEYKTGKAFHIYRPHLIDAEGKEAWGILHIENGIYSVEIPQEFLDKAVYPIKSNDTFGYTSAGASVATINVNKMRGHIGTPASSGTVTDITVSAGGTASFKGVVTTTAGNILASGITNIGSIGSSKNWYTASHASSPSVIGGTAYRLGIVGSEDYSFYYDSGGLYGDSLYDDSNSYTSPTDPTDLLGSTRRYGIYATYTAGGGGGETISVYDTLAFVESLSTLRSRLASVSSTLTLTGSTTNLRNILLSISDSIGLTEAISTAKAIFVSVSDTLNLSENLSALRARIVSISDSIGLTEAMTALRHRITQATDSISLTGSISALKAFVISVSDSLNLSEMMTSLRARIISLSDNIGLTGAITMVKTSFISVADTLNISETMSALRGKIISVSDSIGLTGLVTSLRSRIISVVDTLSLSDLADFVVDSIIKSKQYILKLYQRSFTVRLLRKTSYTIKQQVKNFIIKLKI
jgi:hypothetical protein